MDRRFFENDNVEDLSKNESPKSFQKIEEENEVLKENYMWSDEEDDFSFETDLNPSGEYPQSDEEENLEDEVQNINDYDDLEVSSKSEEYITSKDDNISKDDDIIEWNYDDQEEYSDSDKVETSEENLNCNYQYCDFEEDYEYNYSDSEEDTSPDKASSINNESSTLEDNKRYRENKKYYLKGKKEGYNEGYEAGARDAIRAAYKAGYRRGLRAAGYRI